MRIAAGTIDELGRDQHLGELAAIGAGIGREGAADGAGNAAQELEPGQRMIARGQRHVEVERAGARHHLVALDRDAGEAAHQADHHALDAAVAHQQVRADAQHRHRHVGRQRLQEFREIRRVGRTEQHLGRAAGAEPGLRAERRIGGQPAARLGQPVDQVRAGGLERHHAAVPESLAMARGPAFSAASCWSWPGSACAQAVILPAPRQTTTSPGRATCQIMPGRSPGAMQRMDVAMAGALHQADQHVAVDALDRRLAGGVNVGDQDSVGIDEAGRELVLNVAQPRVAMRLHDGDHLAAACGARGAQDGGDLHRMVAVIVDHRDAVRLAGLGEAALHAAEAAERRADRVVGHAHFLATAIAASDILHVVLPEHRQAKIVDGAAGAGRAVSRSDVEAAPLAVELEVDARTSAFGPSP